MWIFVKTFHSNHDCQRCHYYRSYRNNVLSLVISDYFHKTTNQLWIENSKMTGLKRLQKIPRKVNVSLSLTKRKLAEKNEWNLSNQSGEVTHPSIYLTSCKRSLFFQLPYLENHFMITNLVKLNLIFWKYCRRTRNILVLCL